MPAIVSSLAVIVALIFFMMQTDRNGDAINAQRIANQLESRAVIFEISNKWLEQIIEHPRIMADLHSTKALKTEDESRLIAWMSGTWRAREFIWLQYHDGNVDQATFDAAMDQRWFFATEKGREWWDGTAVSVFNPEFVELINKQYRY